MSASPLPGLDTRVLGRALRLYERCDSTNQRLLEWAAEGAPHGASCLALEQTAGRGRQGRGWTSEEGQGLYASVLLRPEGKGADLAPFSLVVGLSVARALEETTALPVQLKWPNDLLCRGRKVGGVLLELRGPEPVVVAGLGLNLRPPARGWEGELVGRATSLWEQGVEARDPAPLWAACLNHLEPAWERFVVEGFPPFAEDFRGRELLRGRRVEIEREGGWIEVEAEGVDERGRLRVLHPDGRREALSAGEVHLGGGRP